MYSRCCSVMAFARFSSHPTRFMGSVPDSIGVRMARLGSGFMSLSYIFLQTLTVEP